MEPCVLSLSDLVTAGIAKDHLLHIGKDICAGLTYIHGKSIMHRDLKPENILVRFTNLDEAIFAMDNRVRHEYLNFKEPFTFCIADFGLSRHTQGLQQSIVGTLKYMAPEIRRNHVHERSDFYSKAVDIYSLGMLLFEVRDMSAMAKLLGSNDCLEHTQVRALAATRLDRDFIWRLIHSMISAGPVSRPTLEEIRRAFETLEFNSVQPLRLSGKEALKASELPTASQMTAPLFTPLAPSHAVNRPLVVMKRLTTPAHRPTRLAEVFRQARFPQERPKAVDMTLFRDAPALNRLSPNPTLAVARGAAKDAPPTVVGRAPTVSPVVAAPAPTLTVLKPSVPVPPVPFDFQTAAQPSGHLPTHLRGSHRTTTDSISKTGSGRID